MNFCFEPLQDPTCSKPFLQRGWEWHGQFSFLRPAVRFDILCRKLSFDFLSFVCSLFLLFFVIPRYHWLRNGNATWNLALPRDATWKFERIRARGEGGGRRVELKGLRLFFSAAHWCEANSHRTELAICIEMRYEYFTPNGTPMLNDYRLCRWQGFLELGLVCVAGASHP